MTDKQEIADTYQRTGEPDQSQWEEKPAVTGRPADEPTGNSTLAERQRARENGKPLPLSGPVNSANSTLAERAVARGAKRVGEAENKAVRAAKTKRPARKG